MRLGLWQQFPILVACLIATGSADAAAQPQDDRFVCRQDDDQRLCALYRADQDDRTRRDAPAMPEPDQAALRAVRETISAGGLTTANDYFRAATILLHSLSPDDFLASHVVSTQGMSFYPEHRRIRLLAALSLDRYLLAIGRPQIFGTQLQGNGAEQHFRQPFDCTLVGRRTRVRFLGNYPEPCPQRR